MWRLLRFERLCMLLKTMSTKREKGASKKVA